MPSTGKGFGTPAPAAAAAAAPAQAASSSSSGRHKRVRVFRYGVEAVALTRALEAAGWHSRVQLVESLKEADLVLAVKNTAGGRHRNLAQVR
jgi:hypothetical protein